MTARRWNLIYAVTAGVMLAILAALVAATPRSDEGIDWFGPMIPGGWMAWTFPVALFFWVIASLLILFTLLAIRFPETPRASASCGSRRRGATGSSSRFWARPSSASAGSSSSARLSGGR